MPFLPEHVGTSPLVAIELGPEGIPCGAIAAVQLPAPPERVWAVVSDVASYAEHIPMISKVTREGDRVKVHLKFRISLLSVGFDFTADGVYQENHWLEMRYVAGEPKDLNIRFDLVPTAMGTLVHAGCRFDVSSLGWLVKYFLKHHPEIQWGVFPGTALTLLESMRRAVAAKVS
jgi:carbon monoxide dehydrogenase subunit G